MEANPIDYYYVNAVDYAKKLGFFKSFYPHSLTIRVFSAYIAYEEPVLFSFRFIVHNIFCLVI